MEFLEQLLYNVCLWKFRGVFSTILNIQWWDSCVKITNHFQPSTIFAKSSIIDIWQDPEFASEVYLNEQTYPVQFFWDRPFKTCYWRLDCWNSYYSQWQSFFVPQSTTIATGWVFEDVALVSLFLPFNRYLPTGRHN